MSPSGRSVAAYGNGPSGQSLISFIKPQGQDEFLQTWKHQTPYYSDFSSHLFVLDNYILAGFEDAFQAEPGKSMAHIFSFDGRGKVEWTVKLMGEEGGYIFAPSKSAAASSRLVGASDNGEVTVFDLERP